ncbi:MAG TPA: M48 family metallopeptidase [Gammaproteobacteria bacterium]|nr:M48 family metallopeptidase [Gammaproteobacteria bacterium]
MTQAQFESLVARLEKEAERRPTLYKLRLAAFALLGYVYVLGVLLLLVAVAAGLVTALIATKGLVLLVKKALVPVFVLMGAVLRSLWVKLQAPEGMTMTRREHPALFAAIAEVRRATKAPRTHAVLLTNDLNAAIVQIPRLGMLGWQKNYLMLGLPLMQLLAPKELKAVLAHELGHLSGAHGRFGAWIYRVRAGWARLNETLQQQRHWGSFMFVPFFGWFAPKFAAYSFVQARRQEYEADRLAADAVGAKPLGNALVRLDLKAEELSRTYWPAVYAAADRTPVPAVDPFLGLLAPERRGFLPEASEQLEQALARRTSTADTHPSLRDRIQALGVPAAVPPPLDKSAAEVLLGPRLAELVARFDQDWRTGVAEWWRRRHEHVRAVREKLAGYESRPPAELGDDELFERAQLTEELETAEKAFDLYRMLENRAPEHLGAKFACGRLLLGRGDDAGIPRIQEVMNADAASVMPGCELVVGYLRSRGRESEAEPYVRRYLEKRESDERAMRKRQTLRPKDVWLPHAFSPAGLESLGQALARHPQVEAAYLVRKETPPDTPPLHVVGVVRKSNPFKLESSAAGRRLIDELARTVPVEGEVLFMTLDRERKAFLKRFNKVQGARIR